MPIETLDALLILLLALEESIGGDILALKMLDGKKIDIDVIKTLVDSNRFFKQSLVDLLREETQHDHASDN